jgi:hypothetical protein
MEDRNGITNRDFLADMAIHDKDLMKILKKK